ncbi:hypothetical protein [Aminipila terrae]|uniref:Uncharacterized protein n=1 Tax=Aminipila terrae TaxID=2697030 RepID=A0A6P1MK37_9FIRM|nr:hypothetical protein [Aminipila terrae]QHI73503.1 hypothetical protein Ami3637_14950 [Aminipila terrae]
MLLVGSSCGAQTPANDSIEKNLKEILNGFDEFAKLKNGTLQTNFSMTAEKNAVKTLDGGNISNLSITTFILNGNGYDYIEERKDFDEESGKYGYSATKQVKGKQFFAFPIQKSKKEKLKSYKWEDISDINHKYYEPNGILRMMAVRPKVLCNLEYIADITKEKKGEFTKYILTPNAKFTKYLKENVYRPEDNYNELEHREIYWIDEDGLLIKHQTYGKCEYTIDGIPDTYVSDMITELTDYNDKKLTEIDDLGTSF